MGCGQMQSLIWPQEFEWKNILIRCSASSRHIYMIQLATSEAFAEWRIFYAGHQQPIPYDIALLAQIRGRQDGDRLVVQVPPVAVRKPKSDAERQYSWTYEATPSGNGVVGGAWPWLRQGWAI